MALVELLIAPLPAHVRTARLVGVAAARRAGLDDELVDELRLAVGEACARAVGLHVLHGLDVPVQVTVNDEPTRLTVTVTDAGPAAGPASDDVTRGLFETGPEDEQVVDPDVALAVLAGLVDGVDISPGDDGTTVTMHWPLPLGAAPGATAVSR
jgi:anti-sigma regulatory factor (Ser/Thr protein kinase)